MLRVIPPFLIGVVATAFIVELVNWNTDTLFLSFLILGTVILSSLVAGLVSKNGPLFGVVVWLLMIALGSALTLSISDQIFPNHISKGEQVNDSTYIIEIDDEPVVKKSSVKITAEVVDDSLRTFGRVLFYFKKDSVSENLRYGQVLAVNSRLQRVENQGNPNEFNYKRYLRFHAITHRGYVKSGNFQLLSQPELSFFGTLFSIRRKLIDRLENAGLRDSELAVASALILGFRAELDKELMSAYAGAGATHVLAVSGLHVGIVYVILNFLLKFMDKKRSTKILKTILLILLLFGYAGLTGLSASVFRAATMFSFVAIGKALKRDTNIFNTLAASAFCLIAYEPMIIMQVGFQLSYAAVIGIVLIQPKLFNLYAFNNRLLDWAWSISCVSIAAQIATFPLGLLYFHQFPNLFLLSNLLVIPAAAVILYLGFSLFVFSFWEPSLKFFGFLLDTTIHYLNLAVQQIESIPHSVLTGIDISTFETLLIYFIIGSILTFISLKFRQALYASVVMASLFMILQIIEVTAQQTQESVTIYNVRGETAVALISGTEVTFLSSRDLYENEQTMLFHVRHHWWNRGVDEVLHVELNDSLFNRVLKFGSHSFSILDLLEVTPRTPIHQNFEGLDFLVFNRISWNSIDQIALDSSVVYVPRKFGKRMMKRLANSQSGGVNILQNAVVID